MEKIISRSGKEIKFGDKGVRINVSGNLLIFSECRDISGSSSCSGNLAGRGEIEIFSESSRTRLRRYLRETLANYTHLITLTYPCGHGINGVIAKEHLRRFCQELRRKNIHNNARWSAFWFLEFTAAGRIHYHIFTTDFTDYRWIASTWHRICGSISTEHLLAGTRIEKIRLGKSGISAYAAKYAQKLNQKEVPEGFGFVGRFWGVYGFKERMAAATFIRSGQEGQKVVEKCLFEVKKILKQPKTIEITSKIKSLPENVRIWRIPLNPSIMILRNLIRKIELWTAIDEHRTPNYEDQIEELYEELVEDGEFMINWS